MAYSFHADVSDAERMLSMTILLKFILKLTSVVPCLFFYLKAAPMWTNKKWGTSKACLCPQALHTCRIIKALRLRITEFEMKTQWNWMCFWCGRHLTQHTSTCNWPWDFYYCVCTSGLVWIIYDMRWCLSFCLHSRFSDLFCLGSDTLSIWN